MMGELVVDGWSGLTLEGGEELPYSPGSATAIFSSREHRDLTVWALAEAIRISSEASERAESRLGKSLLVTDGAARRDGCLRIRAGCGAVGFAGWQAEAAKECGIGVGRRCCRD